MPGAYSVLGGFDISNFVSQGASVKEQLIEACRRNNVELLTEIVENCKSDDEISSLMNKTTTVMGNHLYHEAALQGNCMFWASHSHLSYITNITMMSNTYKDTPYESCPLGS